MIKSIAITACLLLFSVSSVGAESIIEHVTAAKAEILLKENPEIKILDVRTAYEFRRGHLKNAVNVNYRSSNFEADLNQLDKDAVWLVYCQTGVRSSGALPIMQTAEFAKLINVTDGLFGWKSNGFPIVKR